MNKTELVKIRTLSLKLLDQVVGVEPNADPESLWMQLDGKTDVVGWFWKPDKMRLRNRHGHKVVRFASETWLLVEDRKTNQLFVFPAPSNFETKYHPQLFVQ